MSEVHVGYTRWESKEIHSLGWNHVRQNMGRSKFSFYDPIKSFKLFTTCIRNVITWKSIFLNAVYRRYLGHVRWTLKIYWVHSVRSTITQITKATSPWCFNTNKIFLHYCVIFQTRCWLDNPIRSSRLRYNHLVRNIYGVQIQFIERPEENHFFNQRNGLEKYFNNA